MACALQNGADGGLLSRTLAAQLELTSTPADTLQAWLSRCQLDNRAHTCRMCPDVVELMGDATQGGHLAVALRCTLLSQLRRDDVPRYADFRACCDTAADTIERLCSICSQSTHERGRGSLVSESCHTGTNHTYKVSELHSLTARLRGAARRLSEPDEAFWDAQEHTDASQDLCRAAQEITAPGAHTEDRTGSIAVAVAIQLLDTIFDDLTDNGYVDQSSQLLDIIKDEVCPRLGVQEQTVQMLLASAHLQQYLRHADERMLLRVKAHLTACNGQSGDTINISQQQAIRTALHRELKHKACDIFELCSPDQAPHVLEVVQLTSDSQAQQGDAAREMYLSSVDSEMDRCWASASGRPTPNNGKELHATENDIREPQQRPPAEALTVFLMTVKEILQEALGRLQPFVEAFDNAQMLGTSAQLMLMQQCHRRCGEQYNEWLRGEPLALSAHVNVVREAARFSADLRVEIEEAGGSTMHQSWADADDLKPVILAWIQQHCKKALQLAAAVCDQETWQEPPTSVMRSELEVLGQIVALYAQHVRAGCEDPKQLVRPPPPLTRYKKSLSVKAQAGKDVLRLLEVSSARWCRRLKELEANDPTYLAALREYKRRMSQKDNTELDPLLLRVNSAMHVRASLAPLVANTANRYAQMLSAHGMPEKEHLGALEGALQFEQKVLSEAAADVKEYLGHAAVYVKMSDVWYDKLYQHNVFGRTATDVGVTAQLDDIMNQIMMKASDRAKADTAAAVARSAFAALVTTLLHGGVFRNFTSDDADLLRRDVRDLRALFHAGGEGVRDEQIAGVLDEVNDLVDAMGLATGLLVDSMDRILGVQVAGKQHVMPRACSDYDTLLCILSHRADRMASKYLKERRKMPKLDGKRRGLFF